MFNNEDMNFYSSVFRGLTLENIMNLAPLVNTRQLKAGDTYINTGSVSQKLAYIRTGLMRAYCLKENGDEITVLLRWENQFAASADSIIFGKPSRLIYQAMEDTTLMEMDYLKTKHIIDNSPELSASSHSFLLSMLGQAIERLEGFVLLSPEERYVKLIREQPNINNRVPDKYLATMLGITPVSLSRIRKRIAAQRKV